VGGGLRGEILQIDGRQLVSPGSDPQGHVRAPLADEGAALEGVVPHPGERLHLHDVDAAQTVSGHVDRYPVGAGSTLKLPRP
jgi:hypothetical protein